MNLFFIISKYLFIHDTKKYLFANLNYENVFPLLHFPFYAVSNFYFGSSFTFYYIILFFLKPNRKH